ncbi:MAG: cation-transporting P-type ATPase, partial [bacterium]
MNEGLSQRDAEDRFRRYGPNEIAERHNLSGLVDFIIRFKNPLILILLIAACISAFFGDPT